MGLQLPSREETAAAIAAIDFDALELEMLALPQVECPVFHTFGPGVCLRECHMPAGSVILGHKHRGAGLNMLVKGSIVVVNDGSVTVLAAPFAFISQPGRKLGYTLDETVWINVIPTESTDIAEIEAQFVEKYSPVEAIE
jgi:hypothetical protein